MSESDTAPDPLSNEILNHYTEGNESQRLFDGVGPLEMARTQELLERYLPPAPAVVFDVGGGTGIYAYWLAKKGYQVHLVDAVPSHVEQARSASQAQPDHPITSLAVGDARKLDRADTSVDAVLMLGPLYHLTHRADRVDALREARRILQNGGVVLAAGISRFASTFDGLSRHLLDDPAFEAIVQRDLTEGQHRNPMQHPGYFTTAFFHHPSELKDEVEAAGLQHELTVAIEGPGWLLQNFEEHWRQQERRERLINLIRQLEAEPALLGASAHLMVVARKVD